MPTALELLSEQMSSESPPATAQLNDAPTGDENTTATNAAVFLEHAHVSAFTRCLTASQEQAQEAAFHQLARLSRVQALGSRSTNDRNRKMPPQS